MRRLWKLRGKGFKPRLIDHALHFFLLFYFFYDRPKAAGHFLLSLFFSFICSVFDETLGFFYCHITIALSDALEACVRDCGISLVFPYLSLKQSY